MYKFLSACALAALLGTSVCAQDVAGDWLGTLKPAAGLELRVALHIKKVGSGVEVTMDSVDQGANGIPTTGATLEGGTLKFSVAVVQGGFEGKVAPDGSAITGNWTQQGNALPLEFHRGTAKPVEHKPAPPSDIDGKWTGNLVTPGGSLRVVFTITNTADGLTATAESPDQGNNVIPVSAVTRNGTNLKLEVKALGADFEGTLSPDLKTATGTFTQLGNSLPLVLKK
jgi:opacity protein-like surface antigen